MKVLRYAFINIKKGLKNKKIIGFGILMPLIVITAIYYGMMNSNSDATYADVAINVADKGTYAQKMINELGIKVSTYYGMEKQAIESLKKNDIKAVYIIPQNFSEKISTGEKPKIIAYKNVAGNSTTPVEGIIDEWLNKELKANMLIKNGIIKDKSEISKTTVVTKVSGQGKSTAQVQFFVIMMIINFMIFYSNTMGSELLALKKEHILSRAITTANRGFEIIGGVYLGGFVLQLLIYTGVYLAESQITGFGFEKFPVVFVNMVLIALISTSLGILVVRIFENESMVALSINLFGISTTFLGMAGANFMGKNASWIVVNLSKLTPQYWVFKSIDSGNMFPNAFILILMALVIFTAGNYRVRNFVNR